MMSELEALLPMYCRLLDPTPVGFVCFDRALAIAYATAPTHQLPLDALVEVARRVLDSGIEEHNVVLEGFGLAASCIPLRLADRCVGVVCGIENASWQAKNREIVMLAEDAIAVFDDHHELRFANVAWETLVSRDKQLPQAAHALLGRVLRGEVVEVDATVFGARDIGGIAGPFASALGTTIGAIVAYRHTSLEHRGATTRARERAALAEAQRVARQKDQFIATVSHELRAPLATMLLWERVLRDPGVDAGTRERALEAIHESATAQSRLVADLLDVSRAINGKLRVERQLLVIEDVIRGVVEAARPDALAKHITLVCEVDDGRNRVLGDANRLRQVFGNLLANAIKCTSSGGWIHVTRRRLGDTVEVAVADTGRGIPPELLPYLFEPFRQAENGDGGLGLGLAVAHQLVVLHHGTIVAASDGPGRGATFTVGLPRASATGEHRAVQRPDAHLDGVRVLVIDDDPRVLDALQLLLEGVGAVVDVARSAEAGWSAVDRVSPDVVLSDLALPDLDGCSMMRRIRARHDRHARVPAIAMTSHVAEANRRDAIAAGFDRYLAKPLDVDHLIETIAGLVHMR